MPLTTSNFLRLYCLRMWHAYRDVEGAVTPEAVLDLQLCLRSWREFFQEQHLPLQVRNLYGPLLACVTASKSAFDAMCHQHSPDGTSKTFIEAIRSNPGGREGQVYRCSSCRHITASSLLQTADLQAHVPVPGCARSCPACRSLYLNLLQESPLSRLWRLKPSQMMIHRCQAVLLVTYPTGTRLGAGSG